MITGGIRKFVDSLPNLVVAAKDTSTFPGADYYEIAQVQFIRRRCSADLPATTIRGYVQISTTVVRRRRNQSP